MPAERRRLDSLLPRETPEGASLLLRPAGIIARGAAWSADLLLRLGLYWILSIALAFTGKVGAGLSLLALFLIEFFYPVLFELLRHGATPGKSLMGLAVVMDTGAPVTPAASFTRNLLRLVDFLPAGYLMGVLTMLGHHESRRLGDIAAGTLVVYRPRQGRGAGTATTSVAARACRFALQREELQVIAEFAERRNTFTPERQEELAAILPPMAASAGAGGEDRVAALVAVAAGGYAVRDGKKPA